MSTFPSVTPVAAAAIATGVGPADHHIPSMNWYHRGEQRYVEYGSSFEASRQFGLLRSLQDTVYNMNMAHLTRDVKTVFEHLQDAGQRTAGTTYLMYRGRTRHEASDEGMYPKLARVANFRHAVWGPDELFYADLFASRKTGCRGTLGMPGQRDQHTACVGAHCVENDLFDFMLFSLPDNDTYSHKRGPYAQVTSIASADRALERIMHAAGGPDEFLEDHAVIVMCDHSQIAVVDRVNLGAALADFNVLTPFDGRVEGTEIAVCPSQRSAQVYVLDPERREKLTREVAARPARRRGRRPRDPPRGRRGRRLVRARRAALRPRRRSDRRRAGFHGAWMATLRRARPRRRRRPRGLGRLPGRARADLVGAREPASRRRAGVGRRRLRVRGLGRGRPRGRRQPRVAAPRRLAGALLFAGRERPRARAVVDPPT